MEWIWRDSDFTKEEIFFDKAKKINKLDLLKQLLYVKDIFILGEKEDSKIYCKNKSLIIENCNLMITTYQEATKKIKIKDKSNFIFTQEEKE